MTAQCMNTGTREAIGVSIANATMSPVSSKTRVQVWLPVAIGAFCLLQGLGLVLRADPVGDLIGITLLMSVPGCILAAKRERKRQRQPAN